MLRLPTGIGSSVSSYFPWRTLLKVHSLSERITEWTCAAQFSGRKRVDVLCSAQGHFTLSSHWLHLSKHRPTLAEIKPPNLESSCKLSWNLIAWKERSETNEGKCQFETFPSWKVQMTQLGNRRCAPHIQSVECLQDERLGFDGGDDDDEFCASLGSSIYPAPLCLTYRHRT